MSTKPTVAEKTAVAEKPAAVTASDVLSKLAARTDWTNPASQPVDTLTYDEIAAATGMNKTNIARRMKLAGVVGVRFGKNRVCFTPADVEKTFLS